MKNRPSKTDLSAKAIEAHAQANTPADATHALIRVRALWKGEHLAVTDHEGKKPDFDSPSLFTITHIKSGDSILTRLSRYEALTFAKRLDRLPWGGTASDFEAIARAVIAAKKAITGYEEGCAC